MKTIKEFLQAKKAQFEILLRFTPGSDVNYHVLATEEGEEDTQGIIPGTTKGVIRIIERITDKQIFVLGDFVYNSPELIFIEFMEDLTHCIIINTKNKETAKIEINKIETSGSYLSRKDCKEMNIPEELINKLVSDEEEDDCVEEENEEELK